MSKRRLSVVLLCLAAGCAHSKATDNDARAHRGDRGAEHQRRGDVDRVGHERSAERKRDVDRVGYTGDAERDNERVDIPDSRQGRGRMASAGEQIPGDEKPEGTPKPAETFGTAADNTRVNERDRGDSALTPMDQGSKEDDRELTQRIRKAVVGADDLSFTAKNVKIITRDGHVTLRGAVKSEQERTLIERLAREHAGPEAVTNQLEIAD